MATIGAEVDQELKEVVTDEADKNDQSVSRWLQDTIEYRLEDRQVNQRRQRVVAGAELLAASLFVAGVVSFILSFQLGSRLATSAALSFFLAFGIAIIPWWARRGWQTPPGGWPTVFGR